MSPSSFVHSRRLIRNFVDMLKEKPVVFNSATGFILCAGSDAIAQQIETQKKPIPLGEKEEDYLGYEEQKEKEVLASIPTIEIDFHRFLSAGFIGIMFGGFVYPAAYNRLDAMWHGTKFSSVLKKSCLEIATVGIFVNSISMACRGLCAGKQKDDVVQHVVKEMPNVTLNDIKVWLPYNLIAFSCIPIYIRPTTTAMMEAAWQTYISIVSHHHHECNVNTERDSYIFPLKNHYKEEENDSKGSNISTSTPPRTPATVL